MCPLCVANLALIAAGATSTSGLAAFAANKFHNRRQNKSNQRKTK